MTRKSVPAIFLLLVVDLSMPQLEAQTMNIVAKFKQSDVGKVFLASHSEKDLEKVLAFIQDPVRNFRAVQRVADACSHMYAYANYLEETKQNDDAGYLTFLHNHFRIATKDNVPILTYLVLNCRHAFLSEAWADRYSVLFRDSAGIFVKDLKRRKNWKQVVDSIKTGNWSAFQQGLATLGNSRFELELKKYALSLSR